MTDFTGEQIGQAAWAALVRLMVEGHGIDAAHGIAALLVELGYQTEEQAREWAQQAARFQTAGLR